MRTAHVAGSASLPLTDTPRVEQLLKGYWPTAAFKTVDVEPALALVCEGLRCLAPINSEAELEVQLRLSLMRAVK